MRNRTVKSAPLFDGRQLQLRFFEVVETPSTRECDTGYDQVIREAIADTLDGLDRGEVAELISVELERHIGKNQLDQWCAQSQVERRAPMDALIALMKVTGRYLLVERMARIVGWVAAPAEQVIVWETGAAVAAAEAATRHRKHMVAQMNALGVGEKLLQKARG